ncbi:MAG: 16S rRNA methyltransferase [Thermoplasmata archaeon]
MIADAELELIPEEMIDDYSIRKIAKERGKKASEMILDSNYMHGAISRSFPGMENRLGRPDIIYILLNVAQESILNREGLLRVYVHTKNDLVISINPLTRISKSYNRFIGLMEDVFRKKIIVSGENTLLSVEKMDLMSLVSSVGSKRVITMWPKGEFIRAPDLFSTKEDATVIIGGFSEGDFRSRINDLGMKVSIYPDELTIWTVASEIIVNYERISLS